MTRRKIAFVVLGTNYSTGEPHSQSLGAVRALEQASPTLPAYAPWRLDHFTNRTGLQRVDPLAAVEQRSARIKEFRTTQRLRVGKASVATCPPDRKRYDEALRKFKCAQPFPYPLQSSSGRHAIA